MAYTLLVDPVRLPAAGRVRVVSRPGGWPVVAAKGAWQSSSTRRACLAAGRGRVVSRPGRVAVAYPFPVDPARLSDSRPRPGRFASRPCAGQSTLGGV